MITRKLRNRMTQFITLNSLMKVGHSNCAVHRHISPNKWFNKRLVKLFAL